MSGKRKHSLIFSIMRLSVLPITILGIILTVYSQNSVREGMVYEIEKNLSGIAHNLISVYDMIDAGDFKLEDDQVYKGETELTSDYRILDDMKNDTGADVTIFIGRERRLTTLVDSKGKRLVGTSASDEVADLVLGEGQEYFSESVDVKGVLYFGYYVPIRNDSDEVVGISFAGEPVEAVNTSMKFMIQGNVIICLFVVLLAGFFCNLSGHRIVDDLQCIKKFLGRLAKGEFSHKMPGKVLDRRDELADMGEYAVTVGHSLEDMVTKDPLTGLLNRRAGMLQLDSRLEQECFIVMADIDFFKSVNDSYGHDKGDEVLCFVADEMKELLDSVGFCVRWGGEEFLLGIDGEAKQARLILQELRDRISMKKFEDGKRRFSVSMTFGVVRHQTGETVERVLKRADDLLYYGKEHGRDQIVTEADVKKAEA